ncbi:hypothetical protein [Hyalangium rubrum]|uniref:Lipoprotein n=1 Tax=Hyalangium rubrum TaxID=3103134 RepID=A0ABU5HIV8_9BACT|nr:hypothetical protein [Hyalangium sp. s54d21]MDY7233205.1 hypothetical protein [Hyalangium sp. s54d21]
MRVPCLALLALVLAGCPKNVDRVAGTDDSEIDAAAARLEELRLQEQSEELNCPARCEVATQTCAVTEELCALVEAHPDRTDLPPRCVQAREQCAQANGGCERCRNG